MALVLFFFQVNLVSAIQVITARKNLSCGGILKTSQIFHFDFFMDLLHKTILEDFFSNIISR
ncbi:MAG: hypothetical protein A2003_12410 [Acinetobacter sp. GWC1_38_13]|nr:MAG: hypothetical protein A2003_12410 [Acinetobacter sp. GWC1_38_13]